VGISEQNLEVIFGAFQQGDGTTSRRYGGTGLGLAICRELATQLGGRISAKSVPGEGSTFTLILPASYPPDLGERPQPLGLAAVAADAESENGGPGSAGDAVGAGAEAAGTGRIDPLAEGLTASGGGPTGGTHESLRSKRVLIVDDDLRNAFAISSILELYGMTVLHAPDGQTGIDMLRATPAIDIVLMDVMMPEMDGYATTGAIRKIPDLGGLPVIAVTARAMHGDRDKSIAAGASDYVTKLVDTEELLGCMERWIGSPQGRG
jgi:CheY-like chemotaxis protein